MSATLVALQTANAQRTMKTYAHLEATRNPLEVNQEVLLH